MTRQDKLNIIADIFQSWLNWNEADHLESGTFISDDTHIRSLNIPEYPTLRNLKNWIAVLRDNENS